MEVINFLLLLKEKATISDSLLCFCDPAGTRTQDPIIKSDVLYQLSYEINLKTYNYFKNFFPFLLPNSFILLSLPLFVSVRLIWECKNRGISYHTKFFEKKS